MWGIQSSTRFSGEDFDGKDLKGNPQQ